MVIVAAGLALAACGDGGFGVNSITGGNSGTGGTVDTGGEGGGGVTAGQT